ncbi:MAG TPA: FecR domain-containing protein, partial [Ohtaekwangia sp.]|nr:FecR domain-containing protein [Ohtaekwangia sp.]
EEKVRRLSLAGFWLPVAASVSVLLTAFYLFFSPARSFLQSDSPAPVALVEQKAAKGEKTDVLLSDGSRIRLNADSRLLFPKAFDQERREVTLEGEAYFEVAHDALKPFIVHTSAGSTKVLGTSFNVKAHPGKDTEITLVEGRVNVSSGKSPEVLLSPGQQATIVSGTQRITTRAVDVAQYIAWKNNTLSFNRITLKEALALMEPWYDVTFAMANPALERCIITAQYEDEPIENVLQSLKFLLKVDFKIEKRRITVTGAGCQ